MAIGCLPFLVMLLLLVVGYVAFGIPGVLLFAVAGFVLLHVLR